MAVSIAGQPALDFVKEVEAAGFQCVICDKVYKSKYVAKYHVQVVHQHLNLIPCPDRRCSQKFANHTNARRHAVRDHGEQLVTCPYPKCSRSSVDILRCVHLILFI